MFPPCLFNLYAEYIIWNAGLYEAQSVIKIAGKRINNLRYADDTTLMAESEKELWSLFMKVKEESERAGLKSTFKQQKLCHLVPSLLGKEEKIETVTDFIFFIILFIFLNHCRCWLQPWT